MMVDLHANFDLLCRDLSRVVGSPEDMKELLAELAVVDWMKVFTQDEKLCSECLVSFPLYQLIRVRSDYLCCSSCVEKVKNGYERVCKHCSTAFMSYAFFDYTICQPCRKRERKEYTKVQSHLDRATKRNLPATLTLKQWLATLKYFDWKCAYCQLRPYETFDHFIPLCHDGGTTASNSIPICKVCDSFKRQRLPERITGIPKEDIERVRNYLQQFEEPQITS